MSHKSVCHQLHSLSTLTSLGCQKASSTRSYTHPSPHGDNIPALRKSLRTHAHEHYPSPAYGVYPTEGEGSESIALLLVSNKYSPSNFWNGRWRSTYLFSPANSTLTGTINVTVHYYEDGNVSLTTHKPINLPLSSPSSTTSLAEEIIKKIASAEKAYQVELNTAFVAMNEEGFKGLRRQLPVTRQKVEWEKVGGYRLGSDLRGSGGGQQ